MRSFFNLCLFFLFVGFNVNATTFSSTSCSLTAQLMDVEPAFNLGFGTSMNTVEIDVYGGTPPYNYTWDAVGLVRQAVINSADDTPFPNGAVELRINYGEGASWAVIITDSQGCEISLSNNSSTPTALTIDSFDIVMDDCLSGGFGMNMPTGELSVYTNYGTPPYQYEIEGPITWNSGTVNTTGTPTTNGEVLTLTALPYGWYGVTVTDSGSPSETVSDWFWVPCNRGPRGKTGLQKASLEVNNNVWNNELNIQFSMPTTEAVKVEVFGLTGQSKAVVFEGQVAQGQMNTMFVDAKAWASGMYLVTLSGAKGVLSTEKVVIE